MAIGRDELGRLGTAQVTVGDFVFGHALRAAAADPPIGVAFARAEIASGAFPRLAEAFAGGPVAPSEDRFEQGLQALLEAAASRTD
jgi:hypothetical protein